MSALAIIGFVFICIILLLFIGVFISSIITVKKETLICGLKEDIKADKVRYNMLNEMFNEYKDEYPIKTKYRINDNVYIVDNKKPYFGVIVEIHQGHAREITYTVQYGEHKATALTKTIIREQIKVYKTLAEAIEAEKLM